MFLAWIKKNRFLIFCGSLFLFLRLPSLFEPYWYGDENIYLVIGQALKRGLTLYTQIHDNKPPTLYYLAAIGQTVFGFRLLLLIWMIPTVYVFYKLSQKFLSPVLSRVSCILFLILTSIPLFEGSIANAEVFMLLPTLLAVYFIYSSKHTLIAGLLLGFAFTIKIPVAFEFVFLCFWLLITKLEIKKIILLTIGFIIPTLIYLVYFYFKGAINEFLFAALFQNFGYLSSWTTGSHSGSATGGGLLTRAAILVLFYLLSFIAYRKKIISSKISFLTLWFAATIFGALLSTRPYPHYLIQVLPPLTLLLISLFNSQLLLKTRFYLFLLFLFLVSCFLKYKFYVYPTFSYYSNFYFQGNQSSYFGDNINRDSEISKFIKNKTTSDEKIFVWGDAPNIYALSSRLPVGKYTVAYHIVDFNGYQTTIDQLKINFPRFIVYFPQPDRPFPSLDTFINHYYQPIKSFGDVIIYVRIL